ncbi:MAG: hypothetical protein O2817_08770 [Proteobacteria bacterium]|nr:hypothetical protein [Pseudomonadota bacterium]
MAGLIMFLFRSQVNKGIRTMQKDTFAKELLALTVLFIAGYASMLVG